MQNQSKISGRIRLSYLVTLSAFILHQMDAAYWQEWSMFYDFPPGEIQGYLIYNAALIPFLLIGFNKVVDSSIDSVKYSYFCAGLGILVFIVHGIFFINGYEEFKLPASLIIILVCFFSGCWQVRETYLFSLRSKLKSSTSK